MINQIIHGDCLEVLKSIPDNYFDSLITDPPAGISFMSKNWDDHKGGMLNWINWFSEVMNECLRTMKPGACGLVWSIPRTSHWTGMALELAGFRLIDVIHHCQGEGFPKGQDISKHIDALYGAEREIVGEIRTRSLARDNGKIKGDMLVGKYNGQADVPITAPHTPEAKKYDGWKTPALKPAVEGWWLVQKPISESSIARNILKHGVGGINVEACRIGTEERENPPASTICVQTMGRPDHSGSGWKKDAVASIATGRYPANLILSCGADCDCDNHSPDCPVSVIGEQSGICTSGSLTGQPRTENKVYGSASKTLGNPRFHNGDTGTAARYFKQLPFDSETVHSVYYQAKASTKDRSCNGAVENIHPTVKSRYLMQYLIKLITPPNGIVLDLFGGSGTTAVAAKESGFNYVLIEKEQEYVDIINQRLGANVIIPELVIDKQVRSLQTRNNKVTRIEKHKQLSLFS